MLSLLSLTALAVCAFAALYSRRERRKLERMLHEGDVLIYVHFEPDAEEALPVDVWSARASAMRDNANWN